MKLAAVFALAVLFVICAAEDFLKLDESLDDQWEDFKILHNKQYDGDEIERRMIWEQNLQFIRDHNYKADLQMYNYHLGMNQFGDMTTDEINGFMLYTHQAHIHEKHDHNKHEDPHAKHCTYYEALKNVSIAKDVDYRETGHVTDIKDQGYNNASWAFAAVGAMEGVWFRKKQQLIDLSEQQLIDCSRRRQYTFPTITEALKYVRNHGIQAEETYPYTGIEGTCAYNKSLAVVRTGQCVTVKKNAEHILKYVIAVEGPTSVGIDASQPTFHFYRHGVYDDKNCTTTHHNHAALIVGYSEDHWLVKNSWGKSWGHDGYIEIARDSDNQCGIASSVIYPRM